MPRVIIAEIDSLDSGTGGSQGHYLSVFRNYIDVFREVADVQVSGGPIYDSIFADRYLPLPYNAHRYDSQIRNKICNLLNIRALLSAAKNDIVIFQSSALLMVWLGVLLWKKKRTRVFVINYMSVYHVRFPWLTRLFYSWAKKRIAGNICTMDSVGRSLGLPYLVVPDYIYTPKVLPYKASVTDFFSYDFAFVGIINRSKGVLELAKKFAGSKRMLVIAGRVVERELLNELYSVVEGHPNIEFRPKYLNNAEFQGILHHSRYGILNYSDDYSEHTSGIVYDMLFAGCPIVGRRCRALDFIEENKIGLLYDDLSSFQIEDVLGNECYEVFQESLKRYLLLHQQSVERLRNFIFEGAL